MSDAGEQARQRARHRDTPRSDGDDARDGEQSLGGGGGGVGDEHDEEDGDESENGEEEVEDEDDDDDLDSLRSPRETLLLEPDGFASPLEATVFQLVQDVVSAEWSDEELTAKLNLIAEALEDVETAFRKDHAPPYRRENHLIGSLLQVLDQHEEFYPMLESKLGELADSRVKAAVCRVLLATVPVNSRFIVRLLYEEETLDRMCEYAADAEPPLRCYATGLLAVGLRDRSVADIVVNKDTGTQFLKRVRVYASKLEKERQLATKYIQEHLRNSSVGRQRRANSASGANSASVRTTSNAAQSSSQRGHSSLKRKYSESSMRTTGDGTSSDILCDTSQPSTQGNSEDMDGEGGSQQRSSVNGNDEHIDAAVGEDLLGFQPDPERHEEDLKRLVMLELLYTLDCIGLMGEYLELFAPSQKEDIIGTIVTFLHSKNPTVLSHTMKLTSHFLAHKRFCFSLIDAGGVDLIFSTAKSQQASGQLGLLDRSLSMCLHGLASSSAVVEKILSVDPDTLLSVSFALLSSPNDRARQNAVVFFGLTLTFKVVLEHFEKENGLYTLLNIIRAGNNPKSAVQRQLSHDACLCLRQYLRVHMSLVTHRLRRKLSQLSHPSNRPITGVNSTPVLTAAPALARLPARVPKLQSSKPVDIDDKTHEQNLVFYERYQFSVSSGSGGSSTWSAATPPGGGTWPPAAKLSHLRGILVMLEVVAMMATLIQNGDPEETSNAIRMWIVERTQFCLECLRVLTLVVPALSNEVCSTEIVVDETGSQKRSGMTILLEIAMNTNARDSSLVRDALYVFCNCVSPPHSEDCWQHPHKDIRQYTLTARNMRKHSQDAPASSGTASNEDENLFVCCSRVKDDKALRPVRKLARAKNAIKVCVQLLRYKRSVQNADAIRFLATRALLGLSRDRHIAQILEKMQLGQLLSDLIRLDPVLEENADLHVRFRESALDLISQVTHRAPNAVINEAADPTVRKIEKASIVAQTPITYDQNELLRLIHDHLVSKGLSDTAASLMRESRLETSRVGTAGSKTPDKRSKAHMGTIMPAVTAQSKLLAGIHGEDTPRPLKVPRLELNSAGPNLDTFESSRFVHEGVPISRATSDPSKPPAPTTVPMNHSHRRKRIRLAFQTPHRFTQQETPSLKKSISDTPSTAKARTKNQVSVGSHELAIQPRKAHPSRLDGIITHFLREQHRQCANPVTTVPPFKLLGEGAVHRCPDSSSLMKTPTNICSRLSQRDRSGYQTGACAISSPYADAGVNRYIYSRYRPYRVLGTHGSTHWGASVARFFGDSEEDLLMGNHDGQLRQVHIDSDSIVNEWTCHSSSSSIVDVETNTGTRLAGSSRLITTGTVATSPFGISEIALWEVQSMSTARWRVTGVLSPQFNHYGDRIVALDARHGDEDQDMDGVQDVSGAVMIDVASGSMLCELKDSVQSNDYKRDTNCCFAPNDSLILTGGMLWDARIPTRAVYKFDKLSNFGYGYFHPGGNEVIINSAVWDLRTYQLLRMVPALDKCRIRFNSTGNVMFAYSPHSLVDDIERRRPKAKTWFRVLDARDYKDISTIELQRPIYDLEIDANSSFLSVIEGRYLDAESSVQDDPACRLYEIGRKKPTEDDSDVEDAHDESDTMDDDEFDDESESESGDEDDEEDDEDDDDDDMDDMDEEDEFDEYYADGDGSELDDEEGREDDDDGAQGASDGSEGRVYHRRGHSRTGPTLSARDIQLLFQIPDGALYDMRDEYSSNDEEDADDDDDNL